MRILALTNLYPNPYQPHRAPFNRNQLLALSALCPIAVIAPISWTDEWRAGWKGFRTMPLGRRLQFDGLAIRYPRYLFPPKILRHWYGHFFKWSVRKAFETVVEEF